MTSRSGASPDARRIAEARAAINAINDPCSIAAGMPIGIVDMGIVHTIDIAGDRVSVSVRPTFPGCLYLGLFAQRVDECLRKLPWCRDVEVTLAEHAGTWSEEEIGPTAMRRLMKIRARRDEVEHA